MRKSILALFIFLYSTVAFAGPIIADPDKLILDQSISLTEMTKTIGNHIVVVRLANDSDITFDRIQIDGKIVFSRTTDMLPSGLSVSSFRCDFYLIPSGEIPSDLSLVVGLTYNNSVWYLQYCLIDKAKKDGPDLHIFMLPERDKNWEYIIENREIYYFHEQPKD